jgi:hypothetical protein
MGFPPSAATFHRGRTLRFNHSQRQESRKIMHIDTRSGPLLPSRNLANISQSRRVVATGI